MSTAGPSRSPPRRTAALRVVEAAPPGASRTTSTDTTVTDLQRAAARRTELARRADKWMDKMMEEVLTEDQFQRALSYIHAAQYLEIEHERHLNHLCAYPLCPNAPTAAYRSGKRFVISSRARSITERSDNAHERFCSRKCAARSGWVAGRLGTQAAWIRGRVERLELLEDLERRGDVRWDGRRGDQLVRCTQVKGLEGVPDVSAQGPAGVPSATATGVSEPAPPTGGGAPPQATAATGRTPIAATMVPSAPPGSGTARRPDRDTATDPPATTAAVPAPVSAPTTAAPAGNTDRLPSPPAPAPGGRRAPGVTPTRSSPPAQPNIAPNTTPSARHADSDQDRIPETSPATRDLGGPNIAAAAAAMATAAPGAHPMADLIANLTIVERATPAGRPAPPSAGGHTAAPRGAPTAGEGVTQAQSATTNPVSVAPNAQQLAQAPAQPQPQPQPLPLPLPLPSTEPARTPGRRAASSMISTSNSRLATAVLSASRKIPVPEAASDDGSESEEEWAKEMGWGSGDEVDALFEEARRARELVGEE